MRENGQRTSRSDEGIIALTDAVFKDVFGLNDETISRMRRMIRNQGQWQDLKIAIRTMSGVAHRRLNDVISMAQQRAGVDMEDFGDESEDDFGDESRDESRDGSRDDLGADFDRAKVDHQEDRSGQFDRGMRENKMTFIGYLLTELQYSDEDLRDPAKKQEIMRMMRSGDAQAEQLVTRSDREKKREQRMEIQQETDPRKSSLRRRKQTLQRQIVGIDDELEGDDAGKIGGGRM